MKLCLAFLVRKKNRQEPTYRSTACYEDTRAMINSTLPGGMPGYAERLYSRGFQFTSCFGREGTITRLQSRLVGQEDIGGQDGLKVFRHKTTNEARMAAVDANWLASQ